MRNNLHNFEHGPVNANYMLFFGLIFINLRLSSVATFFLFYSAVQLNSEKIQLIPVDIFLEDHFSSNSANHLLCRSSGEADSGLTLLST